MASMYIVYHTTGIHYSLQACPLWPLCTLYIIPQIFIIICRHVHYDLYVHCISYHRYSLQFASMSTMASMYIVYHTTGIHYNLQACLLWALCTLYIIPRVFITICRHVHYGLYVHCISHHTATSKTHLNDKSRM